MDYYARQIKSAQRKAVNLVPVESLRHYVVYCRLEDGRTIDIMATADSKARAERYAAKLVLDMCGLEVESAGAVRVS